MKLLLSAFLLLASAPGASLAPAPSARPQAAAATETLPSARSIVDRYAEVTGLGADLAKAKSMHLKGRFSLSGMGIEGPYELWSAPPSLHRSEIEMGGFGKAISGYDGNVGWMTHPMTGPRILDGMELLQSKLDADWDAALKPAEDYESLRTLGRETFEGQEAWKIEAVAKALPGMDPEKTREARTSQEFYAVESGYLIGRTGRVESDLASGPLTQVFSDYRDFGGRKLPAKTTIRQAEQEYVVTLDSVEFDTVPPETFRLPPEIETMRAAKAAKETAPPETVPPKPQ